MNKRAIARSVMRKLGRIQNSSRAPRTDADARAYVQREVRREISKQRAAEEADQ